MNRFSPLAPTLSPHAGRGRKLLALHKRGEGGARRLDDGRVRGGSVGRRVRV